MCRCCMCCMSMADSYGELIPVPEYRVFVPKDRQWISLQGRGIQVLFTPGQPASRLTDTENP